MTMAWTIVAFAASSGSWQGPWIDLATKSSILLASAGVLTLALRRRSAATRHFVWMLAFMGLLLLPVFYFVLPAWQITVVAPSALPPTTSTVFFYDSLETGRL